MAIWTNPEVSRVWGIDFVALCSPKKIKKSESKGLEAANGFCMFFWYLSGNGFRHCTTHHNGAVALPGMSCDLQGVSWQPWPQRGLVGNIPQVIQWIFGVYFQWKLGSFWSSSFFHSFPMDSNGHLGLYHHLGTILADLMQLYDRRQWERRGGKRWFWVLGVSLENWWLIGGIKKYVCWCCYLLWIAICCRLLGVVADINVTGKYSPCNSRSQSRNLQKSLSQYKI